jgi:exodeoxyribonuclease V beta subunit
MTGYRKPLPFDAKSVALADSNLIEASAGTGKTYSIALLVLRLVLEQRMPIDKILMVTFTKAAVAELQERVRKFIRQALVAALGQEINDEAIAALVRAQIDARTKEEVVDILQQAVLLLDELSVLTIHSFCQQTLSEFAFETKQQFGAEMFTDMAQLVDQELNKFWRKYVTTMDVALLQQLGFSTLRLELRNVILQHLDGKQYDEYDGQIQYSLDGLDVAALETLQRQYAMESQKFEQQLVATFYELRDEIEAACRSSKSTSKKAFIERLHDAHEFIALLRRSSAVKLIQALPSRFLSLFEEVKSFIDGAGTNLILQSKKRLFYFAIQEVSAAVKDFLLRNNLMGYNDLIQNLHAALLQQPNPSLVAALNEKYKAVFVDEFQDTDREQYEIFITAFTEAILFFIGDPKQSIYAWRKADIFTYFHARSSVKHFYSMNVSYRANAPLVKAMNAFFLPRQEFDTFYFHGEKDSIEYTHVAHHQGKDKGVLYYESLPAVPLSIYKVQKKEEIHWAVARQILQLLSNPKYTMIMDGEERAVKPSDIGILVRRFYKLPKRSICCMF